MADIRTPQPSLSINSRQTVRPTGAQVSQATWDPKIGLDRQTAIEQARQAEIEAYKKQLEDTTSIGVRVSRLEVELKQISADIAKILQHIGRSDVKHQG
jgi:hypothetical protein